MCQSWWATGIPCSVKPDACFHLRCIHYVSSYLWSGPVRIVWPYRLQNACQIPETNACTAFISSALLASWRYGYYSYPEVQLLYMVQAGASEDYRTRLVTQPPLPVQLFLGFRGKAHLTALPNDRQTHADRLSLAVQHANHHADMLSQPNAPRP